MYQIRINNVSNLVSVNQKTFVTITMTNLLILFRVARSVQFENHLKPLHMHPVGKILCALHGKTFTANVPISSDES